MATGFCKQLLEVAQMPQSPNQQALRILVADDEDDFLNIYKEVFSHVNDFDGIVQENRFLFNMENPIDFSGSIPIQLPANFFPLKSSITLCPKRMLKKFH